MRRLDQHAIRSRTRSAATSPGAPDIPRSTRRSRRPRRVSEFSVIGRRLPKVNAWAHLTGQARYADDLFLPRMLYGRLLRATRPHARIRRLDVTRALAHPGVAAIFTGADMPEKMG